MNAKVRIRAALGKGIPGDGTIFVEQAPKSPLIGECIYCGGTDSLTDEHTIPYSLFGVAKLRKATCRHCAVETQKVEQRLIRDTFGQAREFLGFPTRKSRRKGRWSGTRKVRDNRTNNEARVPLGHGVVALYMCYPNYPPRLLQGEPVDERHARRELAFIHLNEPEGWLPDHLEDGWTSFNATDLERCVAKVALCEAIRVVDAAIRDKEVADFVLKGTGDPSLFLGSSSSFEQQNDKMHTVTYDLLTSRGESGEIGLMPKVRLFSFLPTPTYRVVIRPGPNWQVPASVIRTSNAAASQT